MTDDTLSAEQIDELHKIVGIYNMGALGPYAIDTVFQRIPALLRLAKLATPELLALGEAAVREHEAKTAYEGDGFHSVKRWCALDEAGDALFSAARAYAASVASIPANAMGDKGT